MKPSFRALRFYSYEVVTSLLHIILEFPCKPLWTPAHVQNLAAKHFLLRWLHAQATIENRNPSTRPCSTFFAAPGTRAVPVCRNSQLSKHLPSKARSMLSSPATRSTRLHPVRGCRCDTRDRVVVRAQRKAANTETLNLPRRELGELCLI